MTQTEADKRPRAVDYELVAVEGELPDEEPRAGRASEYKSNLEKIESDPNKHGTWFRIGAYRDPSGATNRRNVLVKDHGNSAEHNGWEFSTRKIDETHKRTGDQLVRGLFARYRPDAIVPGKLDEWKAYQDKREAERVKAREAKQERKAAEAKKREAATHADFVKEMSHSR